VCKVHQTFTETAASATSGRLLQWWDGSSPDEDTSRLGGNGVFTFLSIVF